MLNNAEVNESKFSACRVLFDGEGDQFAIESGWRMVGARHSTFSIGWSEEDDFTD